MTRTLIALLFGVPALWLSIYVFGWIVTGDITLPGFRILREGREPRFWLNILVLTTISCALFGLAVGIFLGMVFRSWF